MMLHVEERKIKKAIESLENGNFNDVKLLSEGGYAYTFKAYDKSHSRNVVFKVPKEKKGAENIVREGFKVALVCPHENIVMPYDICDYEGNKHALIMEYIEGESLRQLLKSTKSELDIDIAVKFAVEICNALRKCHEFSDPIVHRDVKPENIIIDYSRSSSTNKHLTAKLTDFGTALDTFAKIDEIIGSLPYMAPEQLDRERKTPDQRSDLYALSVVLYEMLQGYRPFQDSNSDSLMEQIRKSPPPPLEEHIPIPLKRIVYKGLEKGLEHRYQSAADMLCDLEIFLYFLSQVKLAADELEDELVKKYTWHKIYPKLSEMYIDKSIQCVSKHLEYEPDEPQLNTGLRLTMLYGAIDDYETAEITLNEIHESQTQDSDDLLRHPFIKRFISMGNLQHTEQAPTAQSQSGKDEPQTEPDIELEVPNSQIDELQQMLSGAKYTTAKELAFNIVNSCKDPQVCVRLCKMFYMEFIYDHTMVLCEHCITLYGDSSKLSGKLHNLLGKAAYNNKEFDKAKRNLEQAKELGIDDEEAQDILKSINRF